MISYIIATCDKVRSYDNHENVIDKQMNEFFRLLHNKQINNKTHYFKEVVFMVPIVDAEHKYTEYYRFKEWREQLDLYNIPMIVHEYASTNRYYSYEQWLIGCTQVATGEYYLLMEDDYCLDKECLMIDQEMIDLYLEKFPNNIGYLSARVDTNHVHHGYHSSISNGLISRYTIKHYCKDVNLLKLFYDYPLYPQISFSRLFLSLGVPLDDVRDRYKIYFWNTPTLSIQNYSVLSNQTKHHFCIPVQIVL